MRYIFILIILFATVPLSVSQSSNGRSGTRYATASGSDLVGEAALYPTSPGRYRSLFCTECGSQPRQANKAEQEVRSLERRWLDAYERHDSKAMDAIVADDFVITFSDGSMQTKPQVMDSIKKARNPANPPLRFYTEDVKARVYGDTVILIGRVVTEYQRDGKTVKEKSRYTDTYVKRQGRWQVVASHLSNDTAPPK